MNSVGYFSSNNGNLFYVYNPVELNADRNHSITVLVPPFGEELNKSRVFFRKLRTQLAHLGMPSILLDLYGTGDSEGDFADASWDIWRSNMQELTNHLRSIGFSTIHFLGLRTGCILAAEAIVENGSDTSQLMFVQPLDSGEELIKSLLRARVAFNAFRGDRSETVSSLWERFDAGESVEAGGYTVNAQLASAVKSKMLSEIDIPNSVTIGCVEIVRDPSSPPSKDVMHIVSKFSEGQRIVRSGLVHGDLFWRLHESNVEEELVQEALRIFQLSSSDEGA